jgi:2-keto-4-pentenoate hydratase/2-oxohepta-3-ene-1,7-dioic acid hydratase in catechol pathway
MRLVTARMDGGTRLFLERPGGMLDVVEHVPQFAGVDDVGSLLRADRRSLAALRALDAETSGSLVDLEELRPAPPVVDPSKIICIGLNYRAHAAEGGDPLPDKPIIFAKFTNALVGSGEEIVYPHITESLDYEGELGVVIGNHVRNVSDDEAMEAVAGYAVANDVSARDIQDDDPASQWVRGKTLDTFGPMGPYFVSADEVQDWRELRLRTWVNRELRQDELCGDMIFGIDELISFCSQAMTLEPGDIILTGTPSGVGAGFSPPRWLQPGDVVEVEIDGLGRLTSRIGDAESRAGEERL